MKHDKKKRKLIHWPELSQSVTQFVLIYASGSVFIKMPKDILPVFDVAPEASELRPIFSNRDHSDQDEKHLIEANRPTPISVLTQN